jgi:hypothetical protein
MLLAIGLVAVSAVSTCANPRRWTKTSIVDLAYVVATRYI